MGLRRLCALSATTLAVVGAIASAPLAAQSAPSQSDTEGCPSPGETLTVESVPSGTDVLACGLVGSIVHQGRVGVEIPVPGQGMVAILDTVSGAENNLDVSVAPDGLIQYGQADASSIAPDPLAEVDLVQNDPVATAPQVDPCADSAYNLKNFKHYTTMTWIFNASTIPSELTASSSIDSIRAAIGNITGADNDCGISDDVSASSSYGGTAGGSSSVQGSSCTAADGKSLVNFGDLDSDVLAAACSSYYTDRNPYRFYTGDIKINKGDFTWSTRGAAVGCAGVYDLQAVVTHEWGHIFGLAHVSESKHPMLTMSTQISPCDNSPRTLGLGDIRGLKARY